MLLKTKSAPPAVRLSALAVITGCGGVEPAVAAPGVAVAAGADAAGAVAAGDAEGAAAAAAACWAGVI